MRTHALLRRARNVSRLVVICCVSAVGAQAPDDAADVLRLTEVLGLRPGSVVADIGAGNGRLTVPIARHVGVTGKVYSTDVESERLREIRQAVEAAGLGNVLVLEGAPTRTNLSDRCCDAIFMRDVYHHFADPPAMNGSLRKSLRPGARLAIVDFPPRSGNSAPPGGRDTGPNHGITPDTVIQELRAAGFVDVQQLTWSSLGYFLVVGTEPQ